MKSRLEAKLNMYHAVIALCDANPLVVALVLAFSTAFNSFKTTVSAIVAAAAMLEVPTTGYAAAKKAAKRNLAQLGANIAALVYAYAVVIGDTVLRDAMKINYTRIWKAKDDEVALICNNIYNTANGLLVPLADYGLTGAILLTFQNAIGDYTTKSPTVRLSINQRKAIRNQMNTLFADAEKILREQMDKLSLNYILLNLNFKDAYDSARVFIDPGTYHTLLKIFVIHKVTSEPVKNVKSYMDGSAVAKKSTTKGFITYKNPDEGSRQVVLKHKGFKDVTLDDIPVSHGDRITKVVVMEPVGYQPVSPNHPNLKGRVANINNTGLEGAMLRLLELNMVVFSDGQGNYDYGNIPAGTYTLVISLSGYQTVTVQVVVESGVVTVKNFQLAAV